MGIRQETWVTRLVIWCNVKIRAWGDVSRRCWQEFSLNLCDQDLIFSDVLHYKSEIFPFILCFLTVSNAVVHFTRMFIVDLMTEKIHFPILLEMLCSPLKCSSELLLLNQ